ncbi:MAG: CBS domain-containing protein [Desulfobacteraceae bacterium]|nr:MAG: CBS domain-containing protein [Desulfobacteraceae bacterium]
MLEYKAIEIFTSEEARCQGKPATDEVIQYIRDLKIAARCIVTRGIAGCYESGEVATQKLEVFSFNLPVRIYIVLPAAETERVLAGLNGMMVDGIIALHDLPVVGHRTRKAFFPRQIRVRDAMTRESKRVSVSASLRDAARLLLSSIFTGLPVVDDKEGRPVGVVTQGDLINRGGLPLRLGLLAESDAVRLESLLAGLSSRTAGEVMSTPVVTIGEDRQLSEAVDVMLTKGVKRLPVVDKEGRLSGMLSRLDIFRTVMREAPDWKSFQAQKIEVEHLRNVGDILRRDTRTVSPDTSIEEVIRMIDQNDIQRVAVVDDGGRLLGLISDRDLLVFFKQEQEGIWGLLAKVKKTFVRDDCPGDLHQCLIATKAASVMTTNLITVQEEMLIEDAIRIMTEKAIKRLPVVDDQGRFRGMISRDSLLRAGFVEVS